MENDLNSFDPFGALFGLPIMHDALSKDQDETPQSNVMSHLQAKIRALEEENQRLRITTTVILETLIDAEVTSKERLRELIVAALEKKQASQATQSPVPEVSDLDEVEICVCCGKTLKIKDGQCVSCGHFQAPSKG